MNNLFILAGRHKFAVFVQNGTPQPKKPYEIWRLWGGLAMTTRGDSVVNARLWAAETPETVARSHRFIGPDQVFHGGFEGIDADMSDAQIVVNPPETYINMG